MSKSKLITCTAFSLLVFSNIYANQPNSPRRPPTETNEIAPRTAFRQNFNVVSTPTSSGSTLQITNIQTGKVIQVDKSVTTNSDGTTTSVFTGPEGKLTVDQDANGNTTQINLVGPKGKNVTATATSTGTWNITGSNFQGTLTRDSSSNETTFTGTTSKGEPVSIVIDPEKGINVNGTEMTPVENLNIIEQLSMYPEAGDGTVLEAIIISWILFVRIEG